VGGLSAFTSNLEYLPTVVDLLKFWREKGWELITAEDYRSIWQRYGGSVITHPEIIGRISDLADMSLTYRGWYEQGQLQAAIPLWGKYLAGSKVALKKAGKRDVIDMGNGEVILPIAPGPDHISLRYKGSFISSLHQTRIQGLKRPGESCISLLKGYQPGGGFSKKFKYNQRREWRLFQEAGGTIRPVVDHTSDRVAAIYCDLFQRRWGFPPRGYRTMPRTLATLGEFLTGGVLYLHEQPVAIQLVYQVEAPQWLFCEYVNGGVAPEARAYSPGSVLTYLNSFAAYQRATDIGKSLRYSFGKSDREYKDRWCRRVPVYQC